MSSLKWLSGLSMPEPPGNPSALDNNDLPALPQRVKGATLLKPGEQYLLDGTFLVEVTVVTATEVEYRAVNDADAIALGWGRTSGGYEAISDIDDFLSRAEAVDAPVPYLPPVSLDDDGTAAEAIAPASVPVRVFGFNVITIDPEGNHGGPRLDGVVSRKRAEDELDELEPFMTGGYRSVLVEMREVTR